MSTRPRLRATAVGKSRTSVRKLSDFYIRSMPKKPPAPSERRRRRSLRFYENGKLVVD
jgi:hypothetical protein